MTRRLAYLINQYPMVSHSFVRREIQALERQGFEILRLSIRGWDKELPDPGDRQERSRTRYVLQAGLWPLLIATLRVALGQPRSFLTALCLALRLSRRSHRSRPYHLIYLAQACRCLPWLAHFGTRHIHAHFGTNAAEVAMLAASLTGGSYSFTVHGPEEFDLPEFLALPEKIRRAAFVAAISSHGRAQLYRWVEPRHWPKILVVRCGLEPAFQQSAPFPPPDAPRLVCIGRLCPQKGQLLLIEALARLVRRGVECQLVLAGDGEMRGEIEAAIRRHHLGEKIRITGWIGSDAVREEILAARALVLPSFAEGLPVVLMEALALKRPVIATAIAGIPELVRPGENGWLIPAGSLDDLVAAMADCLALSIDTLRRMGEAGCARVRLAHSADTEALKLAECFNRLPGPEAIQALANTPAGNNS